ncbi:MAG: exopolyphosphatase / guanosine-5-triphosphate,3-diphosphate pyrophosphatase, partial [Solirubrobacteraceae bacterium]|nr:exopolyphosphatase / guanosine-5-triphosphate,3-diphosphate pyrophosphatase [Solirubrobacteraceae bacterium]
MRVAVVDIGTNSTRLLIADVDRDSRSLQELVRRSRVTRLGEGVDSSGSLSAAAIDRVLETLEQYRREMDDHACEANLAVLTSAVRDADNGEQFAARVRVDYGFDARVLSGDEEAQLTFLGAMSGRAGKGAPGAPRTDQTEPTVVIDVGGGSTEFIIGTGLEPQLTESLYMGCLSFSLKYFAEGKVDKPRMKAAELAARQELSGIVHAYRASGWDEAVGSSGTARSLENILRENGFAADGLTREGLERLRSVLIKHEKADPDRIAGLRPNRAPVVLGGLAIMSAVFEELGIEAMKVSDGALRHGVLYDLLG